MKVVVPIKLVPDLVEELVIDESGAALDAMEISLILSEFDDHAIEQAILLKERGGGQVTIIAPDLDGADEVLFTAAAKGADRLMLLTGDFETQMSNHAFARSLLPVIREIDPDLILTGVQAHDDLDGQLGPLLAEYLHMPYVGYVAGVNTDDGKAFICKEYPGGLMAEMEVTVPAVFGIQAAEKPPRYVAFSKVRQAMSTASMEERMTTVPEYEGAPAVSRLYQPEIGERATMIEGEADEVASKLLEVLRDRGVL